MRGIKELVGLLFWMDNRSLSTMKAVSDGNRNLSKQKLEILHFLDGNTKNKALVDQAVRPSVARQKSIKNKPE
jgi:hypothetical protein